MRFIGDSSPFNRVDNCQKSHVKTRVVIQATKCTRDNSCPRNSTLLEGHGDFEQDNGGKSAGSALVPT